jgi:biotin carboxyl carrier protein
MRSLAVLLAGVLAATGPAVLAAGAPSTDSVDIDGCVVSEIEAPMVAAEEMGVIVDEGVKLADGKPVLKKRPKRDEQGNPVLDGQGQPVMEVIEPLEAEYENVPPKQENDTVEEGDILAQIDDKPAFMDMRVVWAQRKTAREQALNDIGVRFSIAAERVADADYRQNYEAAIAVPGSVSDAELRTLYLTHKKAQLGIEQAQTEQRIYGYEAERREAELDAACLGLERRKIRSPVKGVVVQVFRHRGEWVKPGDPVCQVIKMDKLRVEGMLPIAQYAPGDLDRKPVTVTIEVPDRSNPRQVTIRKETFQGTITFVDPVIVGGETCHFWAEVDNRQDATGHWLLRPKMQVRMTVHLN